MATTGKDQWWYTIKTCISALLVSVLHGLLRVPVMQFRPCFNALTSRCPPYWCHVDVPLLPPLETFRLALHIPRLLCCDQAWTPCCWLDIIVLCFLVWATWVSVCLIHLQTQGSAGTPDFLFQHTKSRERHSLCNDSELLGTLLTQFPQLSMFTQVYCLDRYGIAHTNVHYLFCVCTCKGVFSDSQLQWLF